MHSIAHIQKVDERHERKYQQVAIPEIQVAIDVAEKR